MCTSPPTGIPSSAFKSIFVLVNDRGESVCRKSSRMSLC
jgi:hypothetical protein